MAAGSDDTGAGRKAERMARWGLLVEQNRGFGRETRVWSMGVLGHVEGTREEALEELRKKVEAFEPTHPRMVRRKVIYREPNGYLMMLDGSWENFHCRFTVAEQVFDSAPPPPPLPPAVEPAPERGPWTATPRPAPPPKPSGPPMARDADVPPAPSRSGRDDLP